MFRTVGPQGSLFELLLPPGMRVLSGELAEIDMLLDDPRFFRPFRGFFDPSNGRPPIPMETYLRLLFLKYRFKGRLRAVVRASERFTCVAPLLQDRPRGPGSGRVHDSQAHPPSRPGVVDELNVLLLGLTTQDGHSAWTGFESTRVVEAGPLRCC